MFNRLQQKWKVKGPQLALILTTFAIGGSVTGYVGRKLMSVFNLEKSWLWFVIYIFLICLLWPLAVILVSILFGQYRFFIKYIRKIGVRMGLATGQQMTNNGQQRLPVQIAIFASGTGSNAQKIIDYFNNHATIKVALIVSNKPTAGVLKIAASANIPTLIIDKENFFYGNAYVDQLKEKKVDFIVLAGFMWKVPPALIKAYSKKILNIHPALLPNYGGKGFYGSNVHQAVLRNKETESGISIHYVDEIYDHGKIIFQSSCAVLENDTADSLAQRIHALEHEHYSRIIEKAILSNKSLK